MTLADLKNKRIKHDAFSYSMLPTQMDLLDDFV